MKVSATEFKTHFGEYLDMIMREPITINENGRNIAVIISCEEYEQLKKRDDEIWALSAIEAQKSGYVDNALEKLEQIAKIKA